MARVTAAITTSVDGYVAGPNDGPRNGLGDGGERLHYWVFGCPWTYDEEPKGEPSGEDAAWISEMIAKMGAVVGGRSTYEASGHWGDKNPWELPGRAGAGAPRLTSVRMSRFALPAGSDPPWATGALALAVAVLALVAAGCNSRGGHPAATETAGAARRSAPCTLERAQRRAIARSLADIRRLRRIQSPLQTFSQHGAPNENTVTGKFLLDLGSAKLPVNVRSHLIHLAKTAADLCGDCSQGLEAAEPFLGNRGEGRCA